jgi:hypothetical protein
MVRKEALPAERLFVSAVVLTVSADAPVRLKRGGPLHGFSHTDPIPGHFGNNVKVPRLKTKSCKLLILNSLQFCDFLEVT